MQHLFLLFVLCLSGTQLYSQFEQQLSVNLSAGVFNTIGPSDYLPEDVYNTDISDPTLIPNFKVGFSFSAGLQYNLSRHLSIEATFGINSSSHWYYDPSDASSDPHNFLHYEILADTVNYTLLASGDNELFLTNLVFGIAPRYYFRPGKKFNPYFFAGINISLLDVHFENNELSALRNLGKEDEYEINPVELWHGYSTNMGFNTGAGMEYAVGDNLGLFLQARYLFAGLKESEYGGQSEHANYNSIEIHLGVRISFLKSKDL